MRVVHGKIKSKKNFGNDVSVTIGNFDGVHLGHQALINKCKEVGKTSVVITFNPHPSCIIKSDFKYNFLTPLHKKIEIIRKLNPDYLFIVDFDQACASCRKNEFIDWLKSMNVKSVVCGKDCHFAYKAEGSIDDLKKEFKVYVLDDLTVNNRRVSTTYVKELLDQGNVALAKKLLNRNYFIEGIVVPGNHQGHKIGFATANIDIFGIKAPKRGVYAVHVIVDGKTYLGMCNIGHNPTFNYTEQERLEVNIFKFNGDLYGKNIHISFIDFIREEKKFDSVDELVKELKKNKEYILKNYK